MIAPDVAAPLAPALERPAQRDGAFVLCAALILSSIFLQKLAIPGTGGERSINLLVAPLLGLGGLLMGQLVFSLPALAALLSFVVLGLLGVAVSTSPEASLAALALIVAVQFPLVLRVPQGSLDYGRLLDLANTALTVVAIAGIVQFFAQFPLGPEIAFPLDHYLPESIFHDMFNKLNNLFYGSEHFKSTGVVMAEPSFFSQYLSIGLLIEVFTRRRPLRLGIYLLGLFVSFSGTGLLMLALVLPVYLLRRAGLLAALGFFAALAGAMVLAAAAGLDFFVDRLFEFSRPNSSGFARFISPFLYNREVILEDASAFWIGRGPGTVMEYFPLRRYEVFDPTWSKIFYEYGTLGTALFLAFFALAVSRGWRPLIWPLTITFFLLGGYLANAFIVSLVAGLLAWPGPPPREA